MACNGKNLSGLKIRYLVGLLKSKKYIVYKKPFQLNIVGVRGKDTKPTKFDDKLNVFWKDQGGKWVGRQYPITTDPSTTYLKKGGIGTYKGKMASAVLPNGQYVDSWKIGYHRGKYKALVQAKPLCVYRDYDRNAILSFNVKDKNCGNFGINIHRAKAGGGDDGRGTTKNIGLYSAGCQVFSNNVCFSEFLNLVEKQKKIYGNKYITYTLFDKWLQNKFYIKKAIYGSAILTGLGFIAYGVYLLTNKK